MRKLILLSLLIAISFSEFSYLYGMSPTAPAFSTSAAKKVILLDAGHGGWGRVAYS